MLGLHFRARGALQRLHHLLHDDWLLPGLSRLIHDRAVIWEALFVAVLVEDGDALDQLAPGLQRDTTEPGRVVPLVAATAATNQDLLMRRIGRRVGHEALVGTAFDLSDVRDAEAGNVGRRLL